MLTEDDLDEFEDIVSQRRSNKKVALYPETHERLLWVTEHITSKLKESIGFTQFREIFGISPPWTLPQSDAVDLLILAFMQNEQHEKKFGHIPSEVLDKNNLMKKMDELIGLLKEGEG